MAPIEHTVEQGECAASIAADYGFDWQTIWGHPQNSQLRNLRNDPNVLHPGDVIVIPDRNLREESCATDQAHQFTLNRPGETLRIRLFDEFGKPRSGIKYELKLGKNKRLKGTTNSNGDLQADIPPKLTEARLYVGKERQELILKIGFLDPHTEISGIQARLGNLGFDTGPVDGVMGPRTEQALCDFQDQYGLATTGKPDEPTCQRLKEIHGH